MKALRATSTFDVPLHPDLRKTVSGLIKILFPHGDVAQDELAEILELALEGRRRVKEQLKKMGSFEYYQTSFSYTLQDSGEERFVGVPEQGGRDLISADPLSPGTVYTAGVPIWTSAWLRPLPSGSLWFQAEPGSSDWQGAFPER